MLRGSIGTAATRWLTRSSEIRHAAAANAASVRLGVAVTHLGSDVVGGLRRHRRGARSRRGHDVDDRGQFLELDADRLQRIACRVPRLGDHRRDRLADVANELVRERTARRTHRRPAVGAAKVGRRRYRLDARAGELGAGVDREHARHGARRSDVDGDDAGVRVRRAQEGDHRLARGRHVVGEAPEAAQQRRDPRSARRRGRCRSGRRRRSAMNPREWSFITLAASPTCPCRARPSRRADRDGRWPRRRPARCRRACSARR